MAAHIACGPHRRAVGTPHDHATARKGEAYFTFLPRYIFGGWAVAWRTESEAAAMNWARARRQQSQVMLYNMC